MHITRIPKGNGKFRTIYSPSPQEKYTLRSILHFINTRAISRDTHQVAHGFMPGRSIVTNALAHVGNWQITLHFDFEDFFDSVKPTNDLLSILETAVGRDILPTIFPDGAARQGLPTSPAVANIAAVPFDAAVIALRERLTPKRRILGQRGTAFIYTRYADDLTFSMNSETVAVRLLEEIPTLAAVHGFKINQAKTTRQHARAGHRIVTGIAVTSTGIVPTRQARRKLRAACSPSKPNPTSATTLSHSAASATCSAPNGEASPPSSASFVRLIPPRHRTDHSAKNTTTQPNKKTLCLYLSASPVDKLGQAVKL